MNFASPGFLWALAAVAVPLLIHLLLRDRIQRVDFPTLRFFAKGARTVLRKRTIRESLLLALRVLLVALLVLAFARPQRGATAEAAGTVAHARVLVLDGSGSMAGSREWLAATAAQRLGEMGAGDAIAVVVIDGGVRVLVEATTDHDRVAKAVAAFAPGHGGTDLVGALRRAGELLAAVPAHARSIVLLSDLQRCGWESFRGDWKLAPGIALLCDTAPAAAAGIVISDADAPGNIALDGVPRAISLRLANAGEQPAMGVTVALRIDGVQADTRTVDLPAKGSGTVRFRRTFDKPGEHTGEVLVQDGASDATRHRFVVRVMARVPVALVGERAAATSDPAFFVKLALAPDDQSPFIVEEVAAGAADAAKRLERVRVAVVADAGDPPEAMRQALNGILQRGGGLLFMPGSRSDPEKFRRAFAELAPCRLQRIISEDGANPQAVAAVDFTHPAFEIFARPHWGDLAAPRFTRYWEVADVQGASVPLRLANGRPLLVERRSGDGIAMLLASPPHAAWNDLPLQAVFLPVLHQVVRHLAVRGLPPTVLTVGERLPGTAEAEVVRPDGSKSRLAETASDLTGFYTSGGVQVAVNRPFAESDPAALPAEHLTAALTQEGAGSAGSGGIRGGADGFWWWWVLLAAAGLAVAELAIGNRTQRH